jgi:hypothetical protein
VVSLGGRAAAAARRQYPGGNTLQGVAGPPKVGYNLVVSMLADDDATAEILKMHRRPR